jgi:hypothetical protein
MPAVRQVIHPLYVVVCQHGRCLRSMGALRRGSWAAAADDRHLCLVSDEGTAGTRPGDAALAHGVRNIGLTIIPPVPKRDVSLLSSRARLAPLDLRAGRGDETSYEGIGELHEAVDAYYGRAMYRGLQRHPP